ncbi:MAG: hypothetical protein AAF125_06235 [Chloroflexota bacterium]
MVKKLSKELPNSPDVYYYAAFVANNADHAEKLLKRALALDAMHSGANRLHLQLINHGFDAMISDVPDAPTNRAKPTGSTTQPIAAEDLNERRRQRNRGQRWWSGASRQRLIVVFAGSLLLSLSAGWLVMLLLGLSPGFVNPIAALFGGNTGLTEFEGTPIAEIENPALLQGIEPSYNTDLEIGIDGTAGDILRDGLVHEYDFTATGGTEVALAVQFFSPFANDVKSNVAILDPSRNNASSRCSEQFILDERTGVAYICEIHVSGQWYVRIFGQEGESSGAYVVSAEVFR